MRVALVTGGTAGIGAATAQALLGAGYRVAVNYGARAVVFLASDESAFITGITLSINCGKYMP